MSIKEKTVWELCADALKLENIEVYPPATHIGECKKPYVVIKKSGSSQISDFSSERVYYTFMVYVPLGTYTELARLESRVKGIIDSKLYPMLMPTGQSQPEYYDDEVKAHMVSFMYRNNIRNKHL